MDAVLGTRQKGNSVAVTYKKGLIRAFHDILNAPLTLTDTQLKNHLMAQQPRGQKKRPNVNKGNCSEVALAAVQLNGMALQHVGEACKADRDIVREAIAQDGNALKYASRELQAEPSLQEMAQRVLESGNTPMKIRRTGNGLLLRLATEEQRSNRATVRAAVRRTGEALQFASNELKGDREIVLEAIKQDAFALQHASSALRADRDIVLEAVRSIPSALRYAAENVRLH